MKKFFFTIIFTLNSCFNVFSQIDSLIIEKYKDDSVEYVVERIGTGERHVKTFYTDGKIREEYSFVNNALNGKFCEWYNNGQIKAIQWYIFGFEAGTWLYYYSNGTLREFGKYSFNKQLLSQGPIIDTTYVNRSSDESVPHYDTIMTAVFNVPDLRVTYFENGAKHTVEINRNRR